MLTSGEKIKLSSAKTILAAGSLLLILGLSSNFSFAGVMSSASYTITTDVLGSGGGILQSTNYTMQCTVGQPSPIGISGSTSYVNHDGFWPTANSIFKKNNILWLVLPAILLGATD
jgi:hypothetical protein